MSRYLGQIMYKMKRLFILNMVFILNASCHVSKSLNLIHHNSIHVEMCNISVYISKYIRQVILLPVIGNLYYVQPIFKLSSID